MVGKVYKVLVDGPSKKDPTVLAGYTETSKMVNFKGPNYLKGEIVEVKILENHTFFLMGELIEDPILIKANSFKNALMKEPLIQEYISLKHTISKDKFLIQLRAHIKELENEYKVSKEKVILNKLQDAEQEYANNPLVSNLNYIGEQVNSLLLPIAEELK